MIGNKLRAWMEAVRPKKKQHRKDKQVKNAAHLNNRPTTNNHTVTWKNTCLLDTEEKEIKRAPLIKYVKPHNETNEQLSRYSATNLSSPESAYSTGYSTDGTSPGAPLDYLLNSSKTKLPEQDGVNPETKTPEARSSKIVKCCFTSRPSDSSSTAQENLKTNEYLDEKATIVIGSSTIFFGNNSENSTSGLVSPRQRNRIRTNPWLQAGTTSAVSSPLPARQAVTLTPTAFNKFRNSPIQHRYLSTALHRRSLSSSSCSSLSAGAAAGTGACASRTFDHHFPRSFSDEDDCTLNEMMGKYDESYVYEKETDILSDGDPTDCESDIDTGQDGGDEDDAADVELDFIDNGPHMEIDRKIDNTGHCLYFIPTDMQRKRSSRRRATRKMKESSQSSDRRRKLSTSKRLHRHIAEKTRHWSLHQDGSKSAGATPVSVRKSSLKPPHCKVQEESLKKRSSSVSLGFQKGTTVLIDNRDREADLKYRELIGQAEQIIRTMNINGLSPRRVPGPTNKRVELLRSTECAKPDVLFKNNKPIDETIISNSNNSPSTAIFKNNRFSPKKNHITNFIINNSPVLLRKELQLQSPSVIRRTLTEDVQKSPLAIRKMQYINQNMCQKHHDSANHSTMTLLKKPTNGYHDHDVTYEASAITSKKSLQPKTILSRTDHNPTRILSPRHRSRAIQVPVGSSSSEEESVERSKKKLTKSCPQSEPLRRKVYTGRHTINTGKGHGKTVAFNLDNEIENISCVKSGVGSSENLRHQVLLNTIQSLKRNLEDQSASLQHTYKSTQNMYKY